MNLKLWSEEGRAEGSVRLKICCAMSLSTSLLARFRSSFSWVINNGEFTGIVKPVVSKVRTKSEVRLRPSKKQFNVETTVDFQNATNSILNRYPSAAGGSVEILATALLSKREHLRPGRMWGSIYYSCNKQTQVLWCKPASNTAKHTTNNTELDVLSVYTVTIVMCFCALLCF